MYYCIWTNKHFIGVKTSWMDETMMLKWDENVLLPYISAPNGMQPIIFQTHIIYMMASVDNKIEMLRF